MRGKTAKRLRKFIKILVENTPEDQRNKQKSPRKMYQEAKGLWYSQGKPGQHFIKFIVDGRAKIQSSLNDANKLEIPPECESF